MEELEYKSLLFTYFKKKIFLLISNPEGTIENRSDKNMGPVKFEKRKTSNAQLSTSIINRAIDLLTLISKVTFNNLFQERI